MKRKLIFLGCLLVLWAVGLGVWGQREALFSKSGPIEPEEIKADYSFKEKLAVFEGRQMALSRFDLRQKPVAVLGDSTEEKRIEVDLTNQRLYAFEGERKVFDFLISSGKWGRTPTGEFRIWIKLRYTKMEGGSKALRTYYYLPNVPYTMYFYNDKVPQARGYGIHGAYWHNNFGHPMSHGCINMKIEEAGQLYYWAQPDLRGSPSIRATADNQGTRIVIYGKAPEG